MRDRPKNSIRLGDSLVVTADGDICYGSEVAVEKYGARKGLLVHRDDLEQPGYDDIPHHYRKDRVVKPTSGGHLKRWTVRDENGDDVA